MRIPSRAAETVARTQSCRVHTVAELVHKGYAVRPRDPDDGRFRLVTLTDAGVAIKQQIIASS